MPIELKKNLQNHNTLGFDVCADYFAAPESCEELVEIFKNEMLKNLDILVIGSGSNILFTNDFKGLVICPSMKDISIIGDTSDGILLKVGAGVDWDFFVEYCTDRGWGGVENLSLIPGNVGASPVQNIGAYGCEVSEVIYEVQYYDIKDAQFRQISGKDCQFGYRDSIFKKELKGRVVISYVTYLLSKTPVLKTDYADVAAETALINEPTIKDIREIIINIRRHKLPDTKVIGNCGSFFKNPIIRKDWADSLKSRYPQIKIYPAVGDTVKIPAAWLIESCGFKGLREGNVGVHDKQALVLLAYNGANGTELLNLAKKIRAAVYSKFEIDIEPEVNII